MSDDAEAGVAPPLARLSGIARLRDARIDLRRRRPCADSGREIIDAHVLPEAATLLRDVRSGAMDTPFRVAAMRALRPPRRDLVEHAA